MTNTGALSPHPRPGMFPEWPEHLGYFKRLYIRCGRMGDVAIVKVEYGGTRHVAFTFNQRLVHELKRVTQRARFAKVLPAIWLKGPIEEIDELGSIEKRMRIVYFRDKTPYPQGLPMPDHLL